MKSDLTFMLPYNYQQQQQPSQPHQPHHHQQNPPPSSSLARQAVDRSTDHVQPSAVHRDVGNTPGADLIDLSRSRRVVPTTDRHGRPSAAVHPHRPASTMRGHTTTPAPVSSRSLCRPIAAFTL